MNIQNDIILQVLYLGMYRQDREDKLLSLLNEDELAIAEIVIGETKQAESHKEVWKVFNDWADEAGLVKPTYGWLSCEENTYFFKHQPRALSEECEIVSIVDE